MFFYCVSNLHLSYDIYVFKCHRIRNAWGGASSHAIK